MSFDLYIERGLKNLEAMKNYIIIARKVKNIVLMYAPDAKVYVFGSVVEGKYTAGSDIDILIVTSLEGEEIYRMKAKVYEELDAPIQLHVVHPTKLHWYTRFASKLVEV
ncbi:MAG: nucleotidyltransferase domain-containing protein [Candidatus Korarchaeota archaeon]|nr:nucleotidyltransferase domain-containing protein [Thermoproteota archaeon]MCR8463211.1 nucleotidyltransferase domain-containing protein [Thermoproteota archaeon]MCR8470858.1 nucleotidyltransferase domain-containing protein [Thermoproteota archaeon]MCR8471886.1 nucleotidyltransferase domain-containing protein [Thermoproteota archaeon]MCR8473325.1 nucleotidyltransferase domain-containing protein [Thermoproteota archaeon]